MKREVERERKLPAFSISMGELEALWNRLVALFENPENIHTSIDVVLAKERLEFDDIEEFKQYPNLKGRVTNFSLRLSKDSRRVSIRSNSLFNSQTIVSATSDSEALCAGAIETVYSYMQSHKVWYSWFVTAPIGWVLFLFANVPTIAVWYIPKEVINKHIIIGWLVTLIALIFLFVFRSKLFPSTNIRVTEEESFIRRHSAELGLIIASISVVLTVVGWFFT